MKIICDILPDHEVRVTGINSSSQAKRPKMLNHRKLNYKLIVLFLTMYLITELEFTKNS